MSRQPNWRAIRPRSSRVWHAVVQWRDTPFGEQAADTACGSAWAESLIAEREVLPVSTCSRCTRELVGGPKRKVPASHLVTPPTARNIEIRRLWDAGGRTQEEIGRRFGISKCRVWQIVNRRDDRKRGGRRGTKVRPENLRALRGESHPRAKLTEAQVDAIRRSDRSQRALASMYGVSQKTISLIKRGLIWKPEADTTGADEA